MITYKNVKWVFDARGFAARVSGDVSQHGMDFVAGVLGMTDAGVKGWVQMSGPAYEKFPHPSMTNFMAWCNVFDHDPREFFTTAD